MQIKAPDLRRRDVNVIGAREIGRVRGSKEAEAVGQHFQRAVTEDALALLGLVLKQGEDEIVFAHPVGAVDLVGIGDFDQLGDRLGLQV